MTGWEPKAGAGGSFISPTKREALGAGSLLDFSLVQKSSTELQVTGTLAAMPTGQRHPRDLAEMV